ncbi:MAG TPA: sigma-54 dependent transcriptional regulator [Thermoanaerobaculales bacterium]|nr:sigma-54 dependent transcriptional regulator [Thermoanaerobaculales bacterium]HQL30646.1 sigma-54 dependent transcriptional regulator [Thermoanaerobaculales bacterium]
MAMILLVEDEKLLRWSLRQRLEKAGHVVHEAERLASAADHLRQHRPDIMLLDLSLPDGNGLDFYEASRDRLDDTVVLVMTAVGQVEDAVRAMKLGALDFLTKPVDHETLLQLVDRSQQFRSSQLEAEAARETRQRELAIDLVAHSESFRRTLEVASDVARSDINSVLITGESGTGKNVVARYIHAASARRDRPLLEVNCAAIPDQLMESELFGHARGAFTDAKSHKRDTFELADGGTVVLDEVAELKLELQSKLLHFLEDRYFRRVGETRVIRVDLRVIALSNRNLRAMVANGSFRNDLFFRLNVFPITVPPLRERSEDILPLARHFLTTLGGKYGRSFDGIDREAENRLLGYSWPGNVRELRNAVERAMILERGRTISASGLVLEGIGSEPEPVAGRGGGTPEGIVPLGVLEVEMLRRALAAAGNNQTRAAELLGISRDQLRYRLKKLNL